MSDDDKKIPRTPWQLAPKMDFASVPYNQTIGGHANPYGSLTNQIYRSTLEPGVPDAQGIQPEMNYGGQFGRWQFSNGTDAPKNAPVGWGIRTGLMSNGQPAPRGKSAIDPGVLSAGWSPGSVQGPAPQAPPAWATPNGIYPGNGTSGGLYPANPFGTPTPAAPPGTMQTPTPSPVPGASPTIGAARPNLQGAQPTVDPSKMTANDWQYYVNNPAVWSTLGENVDNNALRNINAFGPGGANYDSGWSSSDAGKNYSGVFK